MEKTMRAMVLDKFGGAEQASLQLREVPAKTAGSGQVVVAVKAAALNRRDVWIRLGKYGGIKLPTILGSDGAGVVAAVGAGVPESLLGQEVVINPGVGWGDNPAAQSKTYRILGMPDDGTYAEQVVVAAASVVPKPAHLSWAEAAALPLAGLTAYRALCTRGQLRAGQTVVIPGIGSGVSTMVLMLAKHLGARAIVTSSSPDKLLAAQAMGADFGVDYRQPDWDQQILKYCGGSLPDLAVDGAGGDSWGKLVGLMAPGGTIVSYGATAGVSELDLRKLFWKQLNILGSTMGTDRDFEQLVALVAAGQLRPRIDCVLPLEQAAQAHHRMEHSEQLGKLVLQM